LLVSSGEDFVGTVLDMVCKDEDDDSAEIDDHFRDVCMVVT
jgi:hypothetical protein